MFIEFFALQNRAAGLDSVVVPLAVFIKARYSYVC